MACPREANGDEALGIDGQYTIAALVVANGTLHIGQAHEEGAEQWWNTGNV